MKPPFVIASYRRDESPHAWDDLLLTLYSLKLYAPDHEVVVAWKGPYAPERVHPQARFVEQDATCKTFGSAYNFAMNQVSGDCIILNDDVVLLPDTVPLLLSDISEIKRLAPVAPGIVGCRGSFASSAQSYTGFRHLFPAITISSNQFQRGIGPIVRIESTKQRIAPFAAWISREAHDAVGGLPDADWYGDDLYSRLLHKAGYGLFVSRAFVFHIGERCSSTAGLTQDDLNAAGKAWALENCPEVLQ
jgi:hypothetical protein